MHMIRKKTFGFPRCGLLAYHATETPHEVLSEMKSSIVAAGHPLNQVDVAQLSLVCCTFLIFHVGKHMQRERFTVCCSL